MTTARLRCNRCGVERFLHTTKDDARRHPCRIESCGGIMHKVSVKQDRRNEKARRELLALSGDTQRSHAR